MRFEGKKCLVIGGAGFIGSNLSRKLVEEGATVTILDDFFTGSLLVVRAYKATIIKGSITEFDLVDKLMGDADIVFNMACRNIIVSTKEPRKDFDVNAGGMVNILISAKEHPNIKRIVFASSASVYGNARYFPINEDEGFFALNPYAASKIAAESACIASQEMYGVPVTILRYSNVYGVGQVASNPYCGAISKFFECVEKKIPMQIHGDGLQTRDFTYIDDVVEATLLSALSPRAVGEIFNVGTGVETKIIDLVELICKRTDYYAVTYIDRRDIDNVRRRVMNTEKIRRYLRWIPTVNLATGIERTYEWFKKSYKETDLDQVMIEEGYERNQV